MSSISEHLRVHVFGNGSYLKTAKILQTPNGEKLDEQILTIDEVHKGSTLYNRGLLAITKPASSWGKSPYHINSGYKKVCKQTLSCFSLFNLASCRVLSPLFVVR